MSKVFIMTTVHNWDDIRIFHKQAKSLSQKYEVELHAPADFDEKQYGNLKIIGMTKHNRRYKRILNCIVLIKRILKSNASVFHFHDPELIPIGLLIKLLNKGKVVYDIHENYTESILNKEWIPTFLRKSISFVFDRFEKWSSKRFDMNINVIEHIEYNYSKIGAKTSVVKNYPLIDSKYCDKQNELFNKDVVNIIYTGGMSKIRGIKEIIEMLDYIEVSNIRLILVGTSDEEDVIQLIERHSVDNRLMFLGKVSLDEVYGLLRNADIGLVCFKPGPNHDYCLPNKLFEYMSVGLVTVASGIKFWVDSFKELDCIEFVDQVSAKDIANTINKILKEPENYKHMGANGYAAYIEHFNWNSEEKKLYNIYDKLLKGND